MKKNTSSLHRLTESALIAALYTVLTLVLPMASFGTVQLRFSEALTVLPVFTKNAIPGLALGCALANAIGVAMGANVAGVWDIAVGTAATLLAAVAGYLLRGVRFKGLPVLSTLPPILFNAVLIGLELDIVLLGGPNEGFWLMAAQVGAGQVIPCIVGGLALFAALKKSRLAQKIFTSP